MAKSTQDQTSFDMQTVATAQGPVECLGMKFESDEKRREYFLEQLRQKLKDPEFRKIEGFPIGSDEDILALSDPPYYTACPNPFIEAFIKFYGTSYDPSKPYSREPFATDVSEGKNDPIYNAHSYHTKVPHKAIMRYILHYTEPGDVIFDGFCGTGMTGVAAQMCGERSVVMELGYQVKPDGTIQRSETDEDGKKTWVTFSALGVRRTILGDLSPAAAFIAYNYNSPVNVAIGIRTAAIEDKSRRLGKLIDSLQKSIPADDARHTDWFHFARTWAELVLLMAEQSDDAFGETNEAAKNLQAHVDAGFSAWLFKRYAGLVNLPPVPPVMLHHLPRFLARQAGEDRNAKLALIVMDGLAMDQWLVVRTALVLRQPNFRFREESVFAWIPSLTSVSRQAAFAGKAPIFFPNSIWTTDKEPTLWSQFWADQGFTTNEVVYIKGLGDGGLETVSEALSHPMARIVGLVVDKVDRIMHGMEMGTAGMHNQVCQWAKGPYLNTLLNLLLDRGFRVYLTSDHGNVEAVGCGRPAEGAVADLRGERVRVYSDASLRDKVKDRFPAALEWPPVGLPEDYLPLLAPARQAFIQEGQRTVSHGGISVEELIVPLVQIERRGE